MSKLRGKVVVITGASSGLGRATAIELAHQGCTLVLAARRADVVEEVARECRALRARAIAVPADVTREEDVQRIAATTLDRWGKLDVWINNAGVTYYSFLEDGPVEPHLRVIETNLIGCIHGARAAIPIFRRQQHGVLINIGSILSQVGQPFVPSYTISKFGVQGLSEALRVELADEPDIHVCTIFPYVIDTPHFQHAGNRLGMTPYPLQPIQAPETVAREIARIAAHPRRVRHIPRVAALGLALHTLFPRTVERLLLDVIRRWHFGTETQRLGDGNLFTPDGESTRVHGARKPLTTTSNLLVWTAGHLVTLVARAFARRVRRSLSPGERQPLAESVRHDEIAAPA